MLRSNRKPKITFKIVFDSLDGRIDAIVDTMNNLLVSIPAEQLDVFYRCLYHNRCLCNGRYGHLVCHEHYRYGSAEQKINQIDFFGGKAKMGNEDANV